MTMRDQKTSNAQVLKLRSMLLEDGVRYIATALAQETGNQVPVSPSGNEPRPRFEMMLQKRVALLEARYRALLEATPDAIVVLNRGGEILLMNVQAEQQFGYGREELLEQPVTKVLPAGLGDWPANEEATPERPGSAELVGRRKDGSEFPAELMFAVAQMGDDSLLVASIRNGSARKAAERRLQQLEGRYRGLLDGAPDAMVILNKRGKIVLVNAQAELRFGYSRDELIGQSITDIIPIGFGERIANAGTLSADGTVSRQDGAVECMALRKGGGEFTVEVTFSALQGAEGILITASIRDISARKLAEAHLAELESRYRGLIEEAPDAMIVVDERGEIVLLNVQAAKKFGYRREDLLGRNIAAIIPEGLAERLGPDPLSSIESALSQQLGAGIELAARHRSGAVFPIEMMLSRLDRPEGRLVTAAIRDISGRRRSTDLAAPSPDAGDSARSRRNGIGHLDLEEELFAARQQTAVTLNNISDAVACVDQDGRITFLNRVAQQMTGWTLEDAAGQPLDEVVHIVDAATRQPAVSPLKLALGVEHPLAARSGCVLLRRDGTEMPIEDSAAALHDRSGRPAGATLIFRDVRAARAQALELAHSAQHDFLTGLPNRMLFNDRVDQAIAAAPRHGKKVAVLFLDLDGFKHVNDTLGHHIGDQLLQSVGKRLVTCVRAADTVSRLGGDEFVVLLSEVERSEDTAILADRMLRAVAEAHSIDGHHLHVSASIGVSVFPDDGRDAGELIRNADTAMYKAKESGHHCFRFFTPAMNERAAERQTIEVGLRRALERFEFSLHYQPKINLRTGEIAGAEALIRWTQSTPGTVSPADFIPVAESSGLIQPIGQWVLREACRQTRAWLDAGLNLPRIAINVSGFEFRNESFLQGIFSILEETHLPPSYLELELTEGVLMKHAEMTDSILQALRAKGVKLAVDDFGTGYSSLSNLRKFPIDTLKIDKSFIRQIGAEGEDATVVTAALTMARSLRLRCVAEGVETAQELAFLQAHHCDVAQGYYFSKPLPPKQFARLLQTGVLETMAARRQGAPDMR